ncbi:MAG: carbon-nitrogen family hydrolase [Deltaproteobacteria bacterium]|nr:carbon-nitrogen family hydrolase [Deltaproteobacteria bacterium]
MRVALAQIDVVTGDRAANHGTAERMADEARASGADLLVLPEMFATGFVMDPAATAEPLEGPTPALLRRLAREHRLAVVGGFAQQAAGGRARNVALAVDRDGRDLALYAKTHLFAFLNEHLHHEPGDAPAPFTLDGARMACFICYDLRFPELFRLVADECCVVIVIASWPRERQAHFDLLLRARALENQCFVLGVNRVGEGGGLPFAGGSVVVDPLGQAIASGGERAGLVVADVDLGRVDEVRRAMPFLADRRF